MKPFERSKINEKVFKKLGIITLIILATLGVSAGGVSGATNINTYQALNPAATCVPVPVQRIRGPER